MDEKDAVVVGAGPAGLAAARVLAQSGLKVELLEEHNLPGVPFHRHMLGCRLTGRLARWLDPVVILDRCLSVRYFDSHGNLLDEVMETRLHSRTFDAHGLTRELARKACDAGATLRLNTQATSLVKKGKSVVGVRVKGPVKEETIKAKVVVIAQGLTNKPSLSPWKNVDKKPLTGVNVEFAGAQGLHRGILEKHLEVNSDRRMLACTIIPLRGGRWCSASFSSRDDLYKSLAARTGLSERLKKAAVVRIEPFSVSSSRGHTHDTASMDGLVAVGESAGYHMAIAAFASGAIGGFCAAEAVASGDVSTKALASYERMRGELLGGFPSGPPRWDVDMPAKDNRARQRDYFKAISSIDLSDGIRKLMF